MFVFMCLCRIVEVFTASARVGRAQGSISCSLGSELSVRERGVDLLGSRAFPLCGNSFRTTTRGSHVSLVDDTGRVVSACLAFCARARRIITECSNNAAAHA